MDAQSAFESYTVSGQTFEHGDADEHTCAHEWWEDMHTVYTSYPPCYQQRCKKCGAVRYRHVEVPPSPRWVPVS